MDLNTQELGLAGLVIVLLFNTLLTVLQLVRSSSRKSEAEALQMKSFTRMADALAKEVKAQDVIIDSLRDTIARLKSDLEQANADRLSLSNELDETLARVTELREALIKRGAEAEQAQREATERAAAMALQINDLTREVNMLREKAKRDDEARRLSEDELARERLRSQKLSEDLKKANDAITALQERVTRLEGEKTGLLAALQSVKGLDVIDAESAKEESAS